MVFLILDQICPARNPVTSAAKTVALWPKQLLQRAHLCAPTVETTLICTFHAW